MALVDFIEISSRLGWPLFAPPGVPQARVEVLRGAFLFVGGRVEDAPDADVTITTPVGTLGISPHQSGASLSTVIGSVSTMRPSSAIRLTALASPTTIDHR